MRSSFGGVRAAAGRSGVGVLAPDRCARSGTRAWLRSPSPSSLGVATDHAVLRPFGAVRLFRIRQRAPQDAISPAEHALRRYVFIAPFPISQSGRIQIRHERMSCPRSESGTRTCRHASRPSET